jgi:hypothetical protein
LWHTAQLIFTFCAKVFPLILDDAAIRRQIEIECYLESFSINKDFMGFQECILIDDITENWYPNALEIAEFLIGARND